MDDFSVTEQTTIFPGPKKGYAFEIGDDLLYSCIGYGDGFRAKEGGVLGYNNGKGDGYALLTYLASRALNFRRLPFCEDRIYCSPRFVPSQEVLKQLNEVKIGLLCRELGELYQHTQTKLKQAGLSSVLLRRELKLGNMGYAENLIRLKQSADILGIEEVSINMDTLNSFGDEGAYRAAVCLNMEIPIENVLYCSHLVADRDRGCVETGEWVIINRSPTGVITLPATSIVLRESMFRESNALTVKQARGFMEDYEPIHITSFYHPLPRLACRGISRPTKLQDLKRYCENSPL